jgi:hypothetical protein
MAELAGWLILVAVVVRTTTTLRVLLWLSVAVAFGVAVWALRKWAATDEGDPSAAGGMTSRES